MARHGLSPNSPAPAPERPGFFNRNAGTLIGTAIGGPIGLGLGAAVDRDRANERTGAAAAQVEERGQIDTRRKAGMMQAAQAYQIAAQGGQPLSFRELQQIAPDAGIIFGETGIIGLTPVTPQSLEGLNQSPNIAKLGLKVGDIIQHMFDGQVVVRSQVQVNGLIDALSQSEATTGYN